MTRGKRFLIGIGVALLLLGCFYLFTFKDAWATMAAQENRLSEQGRVISDLKAVVEAQPALAALNDELKQQAGAGGAPEAVSPGSGLPWAMKGVLERIGEAGGRVKGIYPQEGGHGFAIRFQTPSPAVTALLNRLETVPGLRIVEFELKMTEPGRVDTFIRFEVQA